MLQTKDLSPSRVKSIPDSDWARNILSKFSGGHYDPYKLSDDEIVAIWNELEPDWLRFTKSKNTYTPLFNRV